MFRSVNAHFLLLIGEADAHGYLEDKEHQEAGAQGPGQHYADADQLRHQQGGVAANQSVDAVVAVGKDAQGQQSPQAASAMHRHRAYRVVNLEHPFNDRYRPHHNGGGQSADDYGGPGVDKGYRSGYADQAGQSAVAGHQDVGFAGNNQPDVEGGYGAGGPGQQGVDGVQADGVAAVDVEAEPAKEQDESADDDIGDIVAAQVVGAAVGVELAFARPHYRRAGQGDEAANGVDDAGAGIILRPQHTQPAAAPDPVAVQGVNQRANQEAVGEVGLGFGALGDGAGDDGGGGAGKDHLEHPVHIDLPVAAGAHSAGQEKVIGAGDAGGGSSHHQGEAEGPEGEGGDGEVHKAFGHVVDRAFGADEAGAEESEPGLHKKDQERGGHGGEVAHVVQGLRGLLLGGVAVGKGDVPAGHNGRGQEAGQDIGQEAAQVKGAGGGS